MAVVDSNDCGGDNSNSDVFVNNSNSISNNNNNNSNNNKIHSSNK